MRRRATIVAGQEPDAAALSDGLLRGGSSRGDHLRERRSGRRWANELVWLFIGFHVMAILVFNMPMKGVTRGTFLALDRLFHVRYYVWATGNDQSWTMFAPTPPGGNRYLRILVIDDQGQVTDLEQDTYGRQSYPYLFHERLRKVNRNLAATKRWHPAFSAWACRQWEREHEGRPAAKVELVWLGTVIPPPSSLAEHIGYDPMELPLEELRLPRFDCSTGVHAQLPPRLRARFGFPESDTAFRPLRQITWANRGRTLRGQEP